MCDHCGCRDLTPIAALMDEHDRLRELTARIRTALAGGLDATARELFAEMLALLGPHLAAEEDTLFPLLRRDGSLASHVGVLEDEHAGLHDTADDLDDADADLWRQGVLALLNDLGEHMYKEDFGLFPAALTTLDGRDWDAVDLGGRQTGGSRPAVRGATS